MSYFKTGLFFLASVGVIVGGLFWVGTTGVMQERKTWVTYFDSSVQGLGAGSNVSYKGLNVGTVESLELAPRRDNLIRVVLSLDADFEVEGSMAVQPAMKGISGQSYLAVVQAPDTIQDLTPGIDFPLKHPLIPAIPGRIEQVESALAELYGKVEDLDIEGLLSEWTRVARSARQSMSQIQVEDVIQDIRMAMGDMRKVASRLERVTAPLAESESVGTTRKAFADLSAASSSLREITASLERELDRLKPGTAAGLAGQANQTLVSVETSAGDLRAGGDKLLRHLRQSAVKLNQVLAQVQNLVRSLQTDPGRILNRTEAKEPFEK